MEVLPEPESPRKRQKVANDMEDGKLHEQTERRPDGQLASTEVSRASSAADVQLQKEAEVGITEFVSPDLPGFTGTLKKRSGLGTVKNLTARSH